ncbi:trehalose-phosphatase [Sphingomonas oleivorans]|uniref:Trehalose 6-phosphate phosphatase n=1 Tax=Sphingomonas oleivorans TaxID=1735121 RepID=A0A2T5FUY7_9SPHN|nr:trehalose-phosphatase [Sphingomonas oleivorans]PTQ08542.1 trehalose-phosphatase [Sphingomonas oleivorans]
MSMDFTTPPLPPRHWEGSISLFLDFDGTLVELAERPDAVVVDGELQSLIDALAHRLDGRLAIVSGRSVAQLDHFFGPTGERLFLAGSHGMERRLPGESRAPLVPSEALSMAAELFMSFVAAHPETMIEHKTHGIALHYRQVPEAEAEAIALAERVAAAQGLFVQPGKMMVELREQGDDKGGAIRAMMDHEAFADTMPLFLGDDLTDEPGFVAADAHGGAGILVGPPRPTSARYALPDVTAVRLWLAGLVKDAA